MVIPADPLQCLAKKNPRIRCVVTSERDRIMSRKSQTLAPSSADNSCAGRSILDILWDKVDETVSMIMEAEDSAYESDDDAIPSDGVQDKLAGRAEGLCMAIAIIRNPYRPDLDAIKDEAMSRYEGEL